MKTKMIINRENDWFQVEDVELNICSISMALLEVLNRRPIKGLLYDRIKIAHDILKRNSAEIVKAVDDSICVLLSKNLIDFGNAKDSHQRILITELGKSALNEYKELIK